MDVELNIDDIKPKYPNMVPLKFAFKVEKLQVTLYFKRKPSDKKSRVFVVELNKLILLKDPIKILEQVLINYGDILYPRKISIEQLANIINYLLQSLGNNEDDEDDYNHGFNDSDYEEEVENAPSFSKIKKQKVYSKDI